MNNITTGVILHYFFSAVLPAVIVVAAGLLLIVFLERKTGRLMTRKEFDAYTGSNVKLLIRWILGPLIFLAFVSILGVRITSLWAAVSAVLAMAAVGLFAGWSLISSTLAMMIILVWRPFRVGDEIELIPDGIRGRLEHIDFMFCRIREQDGKTLILSNSQMIQKMVRKFPSRRSDPESGHLSSKTAGDDSL